MLFTTILQVRSKNIMATLEETKIAFTKDEETNGLKCNVCNVCLNSIQQLQTHLNGNKYTILLYLHININQILKDGFIVVCY